MLRRRSGKEFSDTRQKIPRTGIGVLTGGRALRGGTGPGRPIRPDVWTGSPSPPGACSRLGTAPQCRHIVTDPLREPLQLDGLGNRPDLDCRPRHAPDHG